MLGINLYPEDNAQCPVNSINATHTTAIMLIVFVEIQSLTPADILLVNDDSTLSIPLSSRAAGEWGWCESGALKNYNLRDIIILGN